VGESLGVGVGTGGFCFAVALESFGVVLDVDLDLFVVFLLFLLLLLLLVQRDEQFVSAEGGPPGQDVWQLRTVQIFEFLPQIDLHYSQLLLYLSDGGFGGPVEQLLLD